MQDEDQEHSDDDYERYSDQDDYDEDYESPEEDDEEEPDIPDEEKTPVRLALACQRCARRATPRRYGCLYAQ